MARYGEQLADRLRAAARPWEVAAFVWVPAIAIAYAYWFEFHHSRRALEDFGIFRAAARVILRGRSPFPPADPHALAHFDKFVYPPSTALLFTPLAELPLGVGRVIMLVLGVVCVLLALWLLRVVDWRCYGLAVMSAPAVNSLALGAVTSLLLVGIAATWRYRDRARYAAPTAALTAVSKLFLWPLGFWFFVTRRFRATLGFAVTGACVALGGWAVIGFAGLRSYPRLLHALSQTEQSTSYSPVALLRLSGTAATAVSAAVIALVVVAIVLAARGTDGDRRAFAVAVIGSLVATPILWLHYFLLLLVPIALYRPRLSPLWLAPVLLWATPATHSHGVTWQIAFALSLTALVTLRTVAERETQPLLNWYCRIWPFSRRVTRLARAETL